MKKFIDFCKHQHDVECNQKYDGNLPYSFHLNLVAKQVERFKTLLSYEDYQLALMGAWGHDLIEDARVTYNDVQFFRHPDPRSPLDGYILKPELADIIYACTELRGHNRSERHAQEYFDTLKLNRLGIFVKLCDIIANVNYGLLTGSGMYGKYQDEFPHLQSQLYTDEFKPMWDYLEKLLTITK